MKNLSKKILRVRQIWSISLILLSLMSGITHALSAPPPIKLGKVDTDGDGITDSRDAFPLDPTQSKSPMYCGVRLVPRFAFATNGVTTYSIPIIDLRCGRSSKESVESKNTLLGTDSNVNGIRDDVEAQIDHKFGRNADIKAKTLEMAASYQLILSGSLNNQQINQQITEIQRLDSCIRDKTTDTDVGNAFLAHRQFSTVARTRAYLTAARDAHYAEGPPDFEDCGNSSSTKTRRKFSSKINAPDISDYDVYFINGVSNDEDEAVKSRDKLQEILNRSPVDLLWNKNHFILELFDLYVEKLGEVRIDETDTQGFWKYVISGEVSPVVAAAIWWSIGRWMDSDRDIGYWSEKDLEKMIERIKGSLENNRKTLVISHSQGNFFYRNIHQAIDQWDTDKTKQCFAGIGFAPPLSSKPGNFDYITNSNDKVINTVRDFWGNTLGGNVTVPEGHGDFLGHGLLATYLDHSAPLSRFDTQLKEAVEQLDKSCESSNCAEPVGKSGGQGEHQYTYALKDTSAHKVEISFEAYSVPDKIRITANGKTIAKTNGLVSGFHQWQVDYDPIVHGSEFIAHVDAPEDGTQWKLCIDCEGSDCGGQIERKWVGYRIWNANDVHSKWTCSNHKINGQLVPESGAIQLSKGQHEFSADCRCTAHAELCDPFFGDPHLHLSLTSASCGTNDECSFYDKRDVMFEVY